MYYKKKTKEMVRRKKMENEWKNVGMMKQYCGKHNKIYNKTENSVNKKEKAGGGKKQREREREKTY